MTGDGGAFPEIHVAQYPLGMGTKEDKAAQQKGGVVALEGGEDGSVRYDAIVKQGANKNRIVQTSLKDTKGRAVGDDEGLELPTEEEVQETAQRTQQALSVILDGKVNSSKPTHIPEQCDPTLNRISNGLTLNAFIVCLRVAGRTKLPYCNAIINQPSNKQCQHFKPGEYRRT